VNPKPLVRTDPALVGGDVRGGLTTRRGFPEAALGTEDAQARARLRETLAAMLGLPTDRMAWTTQVHGDVVHTVRTERGLRGEGDALVSDDPTAVLLVSVADCGPILLWDERGPAFGVAHAGWRGVAGGVLEATIEALRALGADPPGLRAWIGPCIGPARFEVGPEVATHFHPEDVLGPNERGRPHVDLPGAIRRRLVAAGLDERAVRTSGDCTFERADLYWSYRRDGGICGRQLGFLTRTRANAASG
jgi:polyphenol oxidase